MIVRKENEMKSMLKLISYVWIYNTYV